MHQAAQMWLYLLTAPALLLTFHCSRLEVRILGSCLAAAGLQRTTMMNSVCSGRVHQWL